MRPWIKYTLIRLAIFGLVLALLLVLNVNPYLAAVIAVIAGFALSYIFFRRVRDEVAVELASRSTKPDTTRNIDSDAEDDALDRRQQPEKSE